MPDYPRRFSGRLWRHLRLSMRGLIVLILVIGLWLGWTVWSARIQHDAVVAIHQSGGRVQYNWEFTGGVRIPNGKPWWPGWLGYLLGIDYLGHVTRVDFMNRGTSDAALRHLGRLKQLEWLQVSNNSETSDAGLVDLEGLSSLRALLLDAPNVTDAGMLQLSKLKNLRRLEISSAEITDAGLAELRKLTKLEILWLGTDVTDAGLEHLRGLTTLQSLHVWKSQVTDAGLARLNGLTGLKHLGLSGSNVTDAGLVHLKGLISLKSLELSECHITNAGLANLKGIGSLRRLDLRNTGVSDAGVKEIGQVLPRLEVDH